MKLALCCICIVAMAASLGVAAPGDPAKPVTREEVDTLARPLIDGGWIRGMVVGVIGPDGTQVYGYGLTREKGAVPDGRTVFEIGSITKAFTGVLLADTVTRKELALEDPVQKLLPETVKLPEFEGAKVTLLHLATHTSALPHVPANLSPKDPTNPYASYTEQQFYEFLSGYRLPRKPGGNSDYSNLGVGLLGHVLARKAGKSYEQLLQDRLCTPLELRETRITLTREMQDRLAQGHNADGDTEPNWDLPTLAGAGALRSTTDDMLRFVKANLNPPQGQLGDALRLAQQKHAPVAGSLSIGLGWHRTEEDGTVWHNGQTGGYHSFAAFNPQQKTGVVVLSNTAVDLVDAVGSNVLRLQRGAATSPPKLRKTIQLDAKALEAYPGAYVLAPGAVLTVSRKGTVLAAQLSGQPAFRIFPEAENKFYYRVVDAQLTFERDKDGKVTGVVLHQNGRDLKAPRQ